jgi:hypothetical protein
MPKEIRMTEAERNYQDETYARRVYDRDVVIGTEMLAIEKTLSGRLLRGAMHAKTYLLVLVVIVAIVVAALWQGLLGFLIAVALAIFLNPSAAAALEKGYATRLYFRAIKRLNKRGVNTDHPVWPK